LGTSDRYGFDGGKGCAGACGGAEDVILYTQVDFEAEDEADHRM